MPIICIHPLYNALYFHSVSKCCSKFAEMAVEAVLKIVDLETKFVDIERIKLDGKPGGSLEDTALINGVVINQPIAHPHMPKVITDFEHFH